MIDSMIDSMVGVSCGCEGSTECDDGSLQTTEWFFLIYQSFSAALPITSKLGSNS